MIMIIFSLIVALAYYMVNRVCRIDHSKRISEQLIAIAAILLIMFLGVAPRVTSGQYEDFYLVHYSILIVILVAVAKIDFEEEMIPNEIVMLVLSINALFLLLEVQNDLGDSQAITISAVMGFLSGGGIFILVNTLQKNGVGAGDIKLFAALGIPLGFIGIISICLNTFLFAAITSLILLRLKKIDKRGRIPLAPFIFMAVFLYG